MGIGGERGSLDVYRYDLLISYTCWLIYYLLTGTGAILIPKDLFYIHVSIHPDPS